MSTQLQLTESELALIEANRVAAAAAAAKEEADEKARAAEIAAADEERKIKDAEERATSKAATLAAIEKIKAADTTGALTIDGEKVSFQIPGQKYTETVEIYPEYMSNGRYHRTSIPTGQYQMVIRGNCTDFKTRTYKNPASMVKKVVEFQENGQRAVDGRNRANIVAGKMMAQLDDLFGADCEITHIEKNSWNGNKYYDTWMVKNDRGSATYCSSTPDGGETIVPQIISVQPAKELRDEVANLIFNK